MFSWEAVPFLLNIAHMSSPRTTRCDRSCNSYATQFPQEVKWGSEIQEVQMVLCWIQAEGWRVALCDACRESILHGIPQWLVGRHTITRNGPDTTKTLLEYSSLRNILCFWMDLTLPKSLRREGASEELCITIIAFTRRPSALGT